jgi:ABC-type hemin transport system substrate-binding protein
MRIVSVVPSITELVYDLGLEAQLVGITKFCVQPPHLLRQISHIGGTKTLRIEAIKKLQPDLVIANKEENTKEQIEEIATFSQVLVTDVPDYHAALKMITTVGEITNTHPAANKLKLQIEAEYLSLTKLNLLTKSTPRVIYLIWQNPWMTVGNDTFVHSMLEILGYYNVFSAHKRYPELSDEDIRNAQPDFVFLSSEPFPFKQKHQARLKILCPNAQIVLVDGEAFSWYGSRMLHSVSYFCSLKAQLSI